MKRSQAIIAVLAVLAVGLAVISSGGGGDDGGTKKAGDGSLDTGKAPAGAVRVTLAFSPEKEPLLVPLAREFNKSGAEAGGKPVFVQLQNVSSGEAQTKIARGTLKPTVWSPASSLWGRLLNFEADREFVAKENPSIVRTPLVIAMWEPMARALGWPKKQIGFADLVKIVADGRGWSAYGHPEFGDFKLVHTNPDFSTSGLSAVVAEYYAATGKKEGLQEKDLTGAARKVVQDLERSIVHYGDTTLFIADQLRAEGLGYASAVAMEEVTLVDFNKRRGGQPKLIALYPSEGTFYSDNPYLVLDAPWVTAAQREGAQAFGAFLADKITPEVAARAGFRPADVKTAPVSPVDAAHGVDPRQPERVLGLPEPRVLAAIKSAWQDDRKPANVLLVVDVSGSMNDEDRLLRAKDGLDTFLRNVGKHDRLGLMTFNDSVEPLVEVADGTLPKIRSVVRGLVADGGTAIYDAAAAAYDKLRGLNDRARINAVVLLTDGEDTDSQRSLADVVKRLRAQGDSPNHVAVYTIAYSAGASGAAEGLEQISKASGAKAYTGDTDDIELVYRSISSFF